MDDALSPGARWEARIARARHLAQAHPEAAEMLAFYGALASFQRSLLERTSVPAAVATGAHAASVDPASLYFVDALGSETMADAIAQLLRWLRGRAPALLAEDVARLEQLAPETWRTFARAHWKSGGRTTTLDDQQMTFVVEAALQPFAETIAHQRPMAFGGVGEGAPARCPCCGGLATCGVLREEAHGARRALVCGLCLREWDYRRLMCHMCAEETFDALGVYASPELPHVRLDTCDTCRTYLKTIDLTKDGHALPIADDLATVSLDLWAREQGYTKVRPNLLRL